MRQDIDYKQFFEELFRELYPHMYLYANSILRNPDSAKDVVQECFITLWNIRERMINIADIKQYSYRMIHNKSLDYIRRNNASRMLDIDSIALRLEIISASNSHSVEQSERLIEIIDSRLLQEVSKLPPKCKEIFIMARYQKIAYVEIAQKLGVSHSTVKNQMSIAMRKLYDALKNEVYEYE